MYKSEKEAEYRKEYQRKNIIYRKANFNRNNPDDMNMVEWLDEKGKGDGVSNYLKGLIREKMQKEKPTKGKDPDGH